jgi:hypothetical protein
MTVDFYELDNFLPTETQDKIERLLTHPSFPWAFVSDSVGGYGGADGIKGACGFFHNFMFNGSPRSSDLPAALEIINAFEKTLGGAVKIKKMNRVRAGLFTKHPDPEPHTPHTDAKVPHWTAVYYVTDCDGDFILYKETYEDISEEEAKTAKLTVERSCPPAKGKMVLFNGKHYHSSSFPTKTPVRIAITFNFEAE